MKKSKQILNLIQASLEKEIIRYKKDCSTIERYSNLINLVSQAFPMCEFNPYYTLSCELPLSFSLIEELKLFMELQFPDTVLSYDTRSVYEGSAVHYLSYTFPEDSNFPQTSSVLSFQLRSSISGSTCVMNKIGTKMVEQNIYEVVCSQEAAEEFDA
jgi:hypothetical protein